MTQFSKKGLLTSLHDRTDIIRSNLKVYERLSEDHLNWKPAPERWSIAQVFEHLNITQGYYFPTIEKSISTAQHRSKDSFNSNWLGDFAYNRIIPRPDGTIFRLPAPKFLHARSDLLNGKKVLQVFGGQLDQFEEILDHCQYVDLQKLKIPFSFTSLIKLRLGDNLRFLVAHNERHLLQAKNVLEKMTLTLG
jgi:hypothetical protein